MKKKSIGSIFDSWLREEGIYREVRAAAIQRVIARQVNVAAKEDSKPKLAGRMPLALRRGR